ncbi:hypothetical protein [Bremerella cremea]|uniref:hypothetical protein n=1 Tax=Bremerella cremea TaxID=1031537 RepID=UPI0013145539|nr:hypothetical protein [Bremerella cremea]
MTDEPEFKIVTSYTLPIYPCGVHAGDQVKLKHDLPVRDPDGNVVATYPTGEIWQVLHGTVDEPEIIWLIKPNGQRHTWDDADFLDSFEVLRNDRN